MNWYELVVVIVVVIVVKDSGSNSSKRGNSKSGVNMITYCVCV